jgi:hypothetical protein
MDQFSHIKILIVVLLSQIHRNKLYQVKKDQAVYNFQIVCLVIQ